MNGRIQEMKKRRMNKVGGSRYINYWMTNLCIVAKQRHEDFAKKRAMHYNMGNVLHHPTKIDSDDDDEGQGETAIPPVPPLPK
jgi:hypothetical protein